MEEFFRKVSLAVFIIVALVIFVTSSISFGYSEGTDLSLQSVVYHFSIFFFLTFFLLLAVDSKKYSVLFFCIFCIFIFAILDEIHQLFVPGRNFSFLDILTDVVGSFVAMVFYAVWVKFKRVRKY